MTENNIPEYKFRKIYDDTANAFKAKCGEVKLHEYNTPMMYVSSFGIKFLIAMSQSGYDVDVNCRK